MYPADVQAFSLGRTSLDGPDITRCSCSGKSSGLG
jgi:hypothetical protein